MPEIQTSPTPDYTVEDHGSIALVQPHTGDAWTHLEEHTEGMWYAGALVVEPRYVADLVDHLINDGYTVV